MTGRGSNGGKAVSLALFFKKFGGEWSYKNVYFIFVLFSVFLFCFCFVLFLMGGHAAIANHLLEGALTGVPASLSEA